MSALAAFWRSTIGKKVVMAISGLILVGFLISHVASNLMIFQGPEGINGYAEFLRSFGAGLWVARGVLLVAAILHVVAAVQLSRRARAARPVGYVKKDPQASTIADRTMLVGGVILLAFIVFHLLHLTTGTLHPSFQHLKPYENMIAGFQVWWVVLFYVVAMVALGAHIFHGAWSSIRTLGMNRATSQPLKRPIATVLALALWLGFTVIPIAVFFGLVG